MDEECPGYIPLLTKNGHEYGGFRPCEHGCMAKHKIAKTPAEVMVEGLSEELRECKTEYRAVRVTWTDCHSVNLGWEALEKVRFMAHKPCTIETVGLLVQEEKDFIVVSLSVNENQCDMSVCIPRATIRKIHTLGKVLA